MENHDINPTEQYDPLGRDEPAEDPDNVLPMDDAVAEGVVMNWRERQLLPCPFCGSADLLVDNLVDEDDYFVSCSQCHVQQIANYRAHEAVNRWNQRVCPAGKHRMDFMGIRDTDGRIFTVCLDCGKREYEAAR